MNLWLLIAIGLAGGFFGGALGLGGGAIMVPALVFLAGMTQHQAQGTIIGAFLPPVFILAAWQYYQNGHLNITSAALVALGMVIGALGGATVAQYLPAATLKKIFAVVLILIGIKMLMK